MTEKTFSERVRERAFYQGGEGEDPRDVTHKNLLLVSQFCKERGEEIARLRMHDRRAGIIQPDYTNRHIGNHAKFTQ